MGMMSELGKDSAYARVLEMIDKRLQEFRVSFGAHPNAEDSAVIKEFELFRQAVEAAKKTLD